MKLVLVIGLLLASATCLYTSRYFENKGFNVKDGLYDTVNPMLRNVTTVCNDVPLGQAPYQYNGTVKSGYLNVGPAKGSSAIAFIFYGKENVAKGDLSKYPTLIWLNGGPGSSSQLGNFMELGPFWIIESKESPYVIQRNQYAWTKEYNIMFVDQPVGTGLSYADPMVPDPYVHSMDDVAQDFYTALSAMYNEGSGCFKDLGITGDSDLFIFGQSYAGKYVPAIAGKILTQKNKGGFLKGLKGIAIGDGFTHPYDILAEVGGFAYNLGMLDYQQRSKIQQLIINSTFQYRSRLWSDLHDSFDKVLDSIVDWAGGVNVYDFTKYKDYPTDLIQEYLWDPEVKKLFKLNDNIDYGTQGGNVFEALYEDFMKPCVDRLEFILSQNISVLIYNGQNDIIVETPGTMRWVEQMVFRDSAKFRDTLMTPWKIDGKVVGSQKKVGYLDLRVVNNAGHLVPMDQGATALAMTKEFVEASKKASSD